MKYLVALILFAFATVAQAQAPAPNNAPPANPSVGVWSLVKHVRFPIPADEVIGRYPDYTSCQYAAYTNTQNNQWWTKYSCEQRVYGKKKKSSRH